ncbi:MAG TPA: type II toxin-antitoxin system YafQ family toxin [Prolixibacteraceae bacterium]|nr:type II toxin-antitoxin system YafQ family toxin [Prolixibacteraceae bacterium]
MAQLVFTNKFKKDIKLLQKRGYNMVLIKEAILMLEETGFLSSNYFSHKLSGNYSGYLEAHIKPDWLIIWKFKITENEVWHTRTGTHSDLFS